MIQDYSLKRCHQPRSQEPAKKEAIKEWGYTGVDKENHLNNRGRYAAQRNTGIVRG
jgi:hypothetical protein